MKNSEQGKSGPTEPSKRRLFFALWPPADVRSALHALASNQQEAFGGRAMRGETLHLTLLFLGDVEAQRLPQLQDAASKVRTACFQFQVDAFAAWPQNGIGYAAPSDVPTPLLDLVAALRTQVAEAGFVFDRRAFVPHVTLLRKLVNFPPRSAISPVSWDVHDFGLVESAQVEGRAEYAVLGCWPLLAAS